MNYWEAQEGWYNETLLWLFQLKFYMKWADTLTPEDWSEYLKNREVVCSISH